MNVKHVAVYSMVKYLYKYVHKGHDHTVVAIEGNTTHHVGEQTQQDSGRNEIQQYLDCSYVSALESCPSIFEFSLQHQYPSVQKLQYHLPRE